MLNMFCQISYAIHIYVPFVQSSYKLNWKNKILICQVQVANKDFFASLTWRQICSGKQSLRHGWNVSRLSSTLLLSFFLYWCAFLAFIHFPAPRADSSLFSLSLKSRFRDRRKTRKKNLSYPIDPFNFLEPQNPLINYSNNTKFANRRIFWRERVGRSGTNETSLSLDSWENTIKLNGKKKKKENNFARQYPTETLAILRTGNCGHFFCTV